MIRSAARFGTPASQSLIGGTISPSSNTDRAPLGIEPGTAPPMSSWCPNAWTNATTTGSFSGSGCAARCATSWRWASPNQPRAGSPRGHQNTGTVTHRSGRCPIPPSDS